MPGRLLRWLIAVVGALLVTAGLQVQAASLASADPSADPTSVDFGTVRLGTSATKSVDLTIDAGYRVGVASITVGATSNPYGNFSYGTCANGFTGPGTCTATISYTPTSEAPSPTGTLHLSECPTSGTGDCLEVTVALNGAGGLPAVAPGPSVQFGDQGIFTTSDRKDFKILSAGTLPLHIDALTVAGDFSVVSDGCTGQTVSPGDTCTVGVTFKPTATGARSGTVTVSDDAEDSPQQVSLEGTGVAPTATFTPSSITFSQRLIGTTSPTRTVTLVNTSNVGMLLRKQTATGDYAIAPGGTCVVGGVVDAGDPCTVNVTFTPTAAGTRDGALVLSTTASSSPAVIPLSGDGTAGTPGFSVNPTSLSFGNQRVGTTSTSRTVTVSNPGTGPLSLRSITVGGNFARSGGTCTSSTALPPGGSCTVTVTFTPAATGTRNGTLTFGDDAATSPQQVALRGTGVAPAVSLSSSSYSFGSTKVGSTSTTRSESVTNTGTAPLSFASFTMAGDFLLRTSGTCHVGTVVAPGATCTLVMVFTPHAKGLRTGSLTIADNAPGAPRRVTLKGTGT